MKSWSVLMSSKSEPFTLCTPVGKCVLVGRICEKMFTFGRKCNFFHKIAQYYANAGNSDRQNFWPPVLFFCYLTLSLGRFQTIFNFAHISHGNSQSRRETTVLDFRRIGQEFLELRPHKNWHFNQKIGLDRYDSHHSLTATTRIILWSITPVIIKLGTWVTHFWKGLIKHYPSGTVCVTHQ